MATPSPVWAGNGVRILPGGYARLPSGERVLLEQLLQRSDLDPYAANGEVRVMTTQTETLLSGRPVPRAEEVPVVEVPVVAPPPPLTPTPTVTPTPTFTPPPPSPSVGGMDLNQEETWTPEWS
jgi:hypothetical protein